MARKPRYDSSWQSLLHDKLHLPYILHVSIRQRPKRPKATVVFLHGIGNTGQAWKEVASQLDNDIRILSVDLLGHGGSPKPQNSSYNVQVQAKAVIATLLHQRTLGKVTLVGHSMGALVAIEVTKRYPKLVNSLVLCSPPLYNRDDKIKLPHRERTLKKFYNYLCDHPEQLPSLAKHVRRYNVMNHTFTIDEHTVKPFLGALKESILRQTALDDAKRLTCPFVIIHGRYDPLVLKTYHQQVVAENPNGRFREISAHHDIRGLKYISAVVSEVEKQLGR